MPIDYSKYPPNWKTEIVPSILKRSNNKCEICGLENKQEVFSISIYLRVKGTGKYGYRSIWIRDKRDALKIEPLGTMKIIRVVLTIAHLDHDETNWNVKDDRLMSLCQHCHINLDIDEKYRRKRGIK